MIPPFYTTGTGVSRIWFLTPLLPFDSDLQYNSDKAAAEGLYKGIVNSAWTVYDTAHEAALNEYDYWEALAYADYTDALDANTTDYNDLVSIALVAYWLEEDTHADTAADAIADAAYWRDYGLWMADLTYSSNVATYASTRATEHTTHLDAYTAAEETK